MYAEDVCIHDMIRGGGMFDVEIYISSPLFLPRFSAILLILSCVSLISLLVTLTCFRIEK